MIEIWEKKIKISDLKMYPYMDKLNLQDMSR